MPPRALEGACAADTRIPTVPQLMENREHAREVMDNAAIVGRP